MLKPFIPNIWETDSVYCELDSEIKVEPPALDPK